MTDPVSLAVAGVAAGVAVFAGILSWPRPPELDGERWFQVALATVLRGEVDSAGGESVDWERRVHEVVRYHPAGRLPELKLGEDAERRLPSKPLEGEMALIEALERLPTREAKLDWMYRDEPHGRRARLADPESLGSVVDPARWLGRPASWDDLAALGAGDVRIVPRIRERLGSIWVVFEGPTVGPSLVSALDELTGAQRFPWGEGVEDQARRALEWMLAHPDSPEPRFVLVGEGAAIHSLLRVLVELPALRDFTHAVISVGGPLAGAPEVDPLVEPERVKDWMGRWFGHHELDTERTFGTPYFCVEWMEESQPALGAGGWPLASQRFPEPRWESRTALSVDVVDLGPVSVHADPALVAKALFWTVSGWVALHQ